MPRPPPYFYHLEFELYPYPSTTAQREAKGTVTSARAWVPAQGTNIFHTKNWPLHRPRGLVPWRGQQATDNQSISGVGQQNSTVPKGRERDREREAVIDCGVSRAVSSSEEAEDVLIALASSRTLGDGFPPPHPSVLASSLQRAERDWRFADVRVEALDMDAEMGSVLRSNRHGNNGNGNSNANSKSKDNSNFNRYRMEGERRRGSSSIGAGLRSMEEVGRGITAGLDPGTASLRRVTKAHFEPVVGKSTEVGWGVVHLYRDGEETSSLEAGGEGEEGVAEECTTLCIPAVPNYMTPSDFLGWVGEKTREIVSHFRMVMTGRLMRYLVLMKFRDRRAARKWREEWDGRVFSSMEPETCHVVFIKSIKFRTPTTSSSTSFPSLIYDPFTPPTISSTTPATTLKPFPPPTPSLIELPTCPVCLERMDDTTGLLTILCQHVFHCNCLLKWTDSSCPVCRHTNPSSSSHLLSDSERPFGSSEASLCSTCDCADDLWICLICGNVGCGRYKGGHAKQHWKESAHCFSLEIETQHVWDYAADVWVHRLIRDKGDKSKVIELPGHSRSRSDANVESFSEDMVPRSKLDFLSIEYTHLLTCQLESQRVYFEELVSKGAAKASAATSAAAVVAASASMMQTQVEELQAENQRLRNEFAEQSRQLEREKRKSAKSSEMARGFGTSLVEERRVGEGLMQRIEHLNQGMLGLRNELDRLRTENCELADTNRDLLFSISAQHKIRHLEDLGDVARDEMVGGSVVVGGGGSVVGGGAVASSGEKGSGLRAGPEKGKVKGKGKGKMKGKES